MFRFRRFQSRILLYLLGPFLLVNASLIVAIDRESQQTARETIDEGLELTARAFTAALANRRARLLEHLRASAGDFGFKSAVATRDQRTIASALENYSLRVGANVMIYVDIQQTVLAEVYLDADQHIIGGEDPRERSARGDELPALIREVQKKGAQETESIEFLNGIPYQLVVLPIRAPLPVGWLIIGFTIDEAFVEDLKRNTNSDVSILRSVGGARQIVASTLPEEMQNALIGAWQQEMGQLGSSHTVRIRDYDWVTLAMKLPNRPGNEIVAILQRSLREYLEPFRFLQEFTYTLFAAGALLFIIVGIAIARSVTRPVTELARMAHRVQEGDFNNQIEVRLEDEIGDLGRAFNHMTRGLAERAKVLSLLGKVVSAEIATELLKDEIKLGGEERRVTVLFADIRDFTPLCEGRSPEAILNLLNRYLTRMTRVIEEHSGVVDKYIGDAIMALFGAPVTGEHDERNAIRCALGMWEQLTALNAELARGGDPQIQIGIGVNTGRVVVGNMGSESRLNYTVIGDGVNLSSRLEGLTKVYGCPVIVSDSTRAACDEFEYLELDRVQVKGKREPISIWQPLAARGTLDAAARERRRRFEVALAMYRARDWHGAGEAFAALSAGAPADRLFALYRQRAEAYAVEPPGPDWDGVVKFEEK